MQIINDIGWFGDTEHNVLGMLNHPNVTHTITPVGGTTGFQSLLLMDPDEVLRLAQITGLAEAFREEAFTEAWEAIINVEDEADADEE